VLGSVAGAELGLEGALALSAEVLRVVREHPRRPILVLVDSRGQRMSRRDELLGLNGLLGHLATCVELARRRDHRVLALVRGDAVSGGEPLYRVHAEYSSDLAFAREWAANGSGYTIGGPGELPREFSEF
jgi:hypothetical protein